jgi:hypothetical protein
MDSNTSNKVTWAAIIAVGVPTLYAGLIELLNDKLAYELVGQWGYPRILMVLVGLIQIVGVVLLLNRRTATFAAGLLAAVMIGALATLLAAGQTPYALVTLVFLGLLFFIGWERSRVRAHLLESHSHHEQHA